MPKSKLMCSWERVVDNWAGDDPTKKAIGKDLDERFKSLLAPVNYARGLLPVFTNDERATVFCDGCKAVPALAVLVWCILESMSGRAIVGSCIGR